MHPKVGGFLLTLMPLVVVLPTTNTEYVEQSVSFHKVAVTTGDNYRSMLMRNMHLEPDKTAACFSLAMSYKQMVKGVVMTNDWCHLMGYSDSCPKNIGISSPIFTAEDRYWQMVKFCDGGGVCMRDNEKMNFLRKDPSSPIQVETIFTSSSNESFGGPLGFCGPDVTIRSNLKVPEAPEPLWFKVVVGGIKIIYLVYVKGPDLENNDLQSALVVVSLDDMIPEYGTTTFDQWGGKCGEVDIEERYLQRSIVKCGANGYKGTNLVLYQPSGLKMVIEELELFPFKLDVSGGAKN